MRILVTGSDGYIGAVLAPYLAEAGHEVVGMDSGLFADCSFGPQPRRLPTMALDIRDVGPGDLEGFDVQPVRRRGRRRVPGRAGRLQPGHALRGVQGAGRAGHRRPGRGQLQPDVPAQRHRLGVSPRLRGDVVVNNLVGIAFTTGAAEGVEQLYSAFKEHGLDAADLTGWRFQRIARIGALLEGGRLDPDLRWRRP